MGSTLFSSLGTPSYNAKLSKPSKSSPKFRIVSACMAAAATRPTTPTSFGFENLMDTFTVNIHRAEGRPLNVPLISPFTIATSRLVSVENVGIRIELTNGCVGWGEAPILPFVTAEDQPMALGKTEETCEFLRQTHGRTLGMVLKEIGEFLPGHAFASVSLNETFKLFPPFYCASNSILLVTKHMLFVGQILYQSVLGNKQE